MATMKDPVTGLPILQRGPQPMPNPTRQQADAAMGQLQKALFQTQQNLNTYYSLCCLMVQAAGGKVDIDITTLPPPPMRLDIREAGTIVTIEAISASEEQ